MRSGKTGDQWHFGMKVHFGTDPQGRAHSVAVTDASVHDSQMMDGLLHGEEEVIYADNAYANQDKQSAMESTGVSWGVNRKSTRNRKLNCADRAFNHKSNRTRARVERLFGVIDNDLPTQNLPVGLVFGLQDIQSFVANVHDQVIITNTMKQRYKDIHCHHLPRFMTNPD